MWSIIATVVIGMVCFLVILFLCFFAAGLVNRAVHEESLREKRERDKERIFRTEKGEIGTIYVE